MSAPIGPPPLRIDLVYAEWCPHCVPLSLEKGSALSKKLRIPLRTLNIDVPEEEREADRLVLAHGDWTEDYLVPQAFLVFGDGSVRHLLTGVPGSVDATRRAWDALLARA